jgi:CBS-domain-containing membrane protein
LRDFYVLLGVAPAPLEEKGLDGMAVDLVFLILASDQKNTVMLQTMAAIGGVAKDADCLAQLRRGDSPKAVWHAIDEGDFKVKKGLFARDLMHKPAVVACEDMPLGELLDAFFQHRVYAAPVCTPDGRVVGTVTTGEIVDAGFPEYMSRMRDIAFLAEFEPFEEFFKKEATTRVADIMSRDPLIVDADDPMIQVVFRMKTEQRGIAFVQEDGQLVGIIGRNDIVSRILRA